MITPLQRTLALGGRDPARTCQSARPCPWRARTARRGGHMSHVRMRPLVTRAPWGAHAPTPPCGGDMGVHAPLPPCAHAPPQSEVGARGCMPPSLPPRPPAPRGTSPPRRLVGTRGCVSPPCPHAPLVPDTPGGVGCGSPVPHRARVESTLDLRLRFPCRPASPQSLKH